ncbi:hypothetical protein K431DRAFT_284834 [Polychaeton citri CBS 116435]|uniref:VOC domain-containing protein n=1 Tax=Polychaeton citri CBS 116435 TaxID=1314669 RepID=A0A9P4Q6F0_9PEZI|nr:hypothetical protein K431DRAFT_284834 [Polychaeton citri CBS 116435]
MSTQQVAFRPQVLGIHHIKLAVSNLDISIAWYERVLGAQRVPELDHIRIDGTRYAAVCRMDDWQGLYVELRVVEQTRALRELLWDPITLAVQEAQDLQEWLTWLERWRTSHSPILVGVRGWILVFEDPDGRRFRIFTREDHGGTEIPSVDDYWLGEA